MKKLAFTLAEVLITLGIIGVVAAMTMPILMTNIRKHHAETALAKAVSTLNQVLKTSEQENGNISALDTNKITQEQFINQFIKPYMKVSELCNPITQCGYTSATPWKYFNGHDAGAYGNPNYGGRTPFLGADGILYAVSFFSDDSGAQSTDNNNTIILDINGAQPPNIFGKDVFFLYRRTDVDEITTYGYDKSDEEVKQNCSENGRGFYCATLIARNGWKIPRSYKF